MVFADWQVGEVFWAMLLFSLLFPWGYAVWTLFVILLPFLGGFSYLFERGQRG